MDSEPKQWVLLIYRLAIEPSRMRTYVWRQLKALGALYYQQAVWILPKRPELDSALDAIVAKIESFGGEASLLTTISPTPAWQADVMARFNAARDEEYTEIVENEERFEDEVSRESARGKFTFAELEDLESDRDKLQRWYERVSARDFFGAPAQKAALSKLNAAKELLQDFTEQVYEREKVEKPS